MPRPGKTNSQIHECQLTYLGREGYLKPIEKKKTPGHNENFIILRVSNFLSPPVEIAKKLSLKPTRTRVKGKTFYIGKHKQIKRVAEFNSWEYEVKTRSNDKLIDEIDSFVNGILRPRVRSLKGISAEADISLFVAQYYYNGCNPEYFFSKQTIKVLSQVNAEIHMDIYCLGGAE